MQVPVDHSISRTGVRSFYSTENILRMTNERNLDYNKLLKINIEKMLSDNLRAKDVQDILNIFDKYNKSLLLEPLDRTTELTAKELLNQLTKYEDWFPPLIKCLKDKRIQLSRLAKKLKEIEVNVRRHQLKNSERLSSDGGRRFRLFGLFRKRKSDTKQYSASETNLSNYESIGSIDSLNGSSSRSTGEYLKKCPCQLNALLRSLSANTTSAFRNNFEDIRRNISLVLDIIKEYKNCILILEPILKTYNLKDLILRICQTKPNEETDMAYGIQIKLPSLEIVIYLINFNTSIAKMEKSLAEDWFQFIFKELQNLPKTFSSCNDMEMRNSLGRLKRNLIIILLGIVRHVTSGKEYFSADHWKKLLQELRDDEDKFVSDLSLFVQVYIYEDRKILKFLKEKQKNIKDIVQGLQDFIKFFSTYNTPSNLAHVELHTYIDGLARLASIEQFAELIKKEDILKHVHNNVQHVNDQMIYKSYLHLITTLGFPIGNDFRTTSVADSSLSVSTKPNVLPDEDSETYENIDEPSSLVVSSNIARKSDRCIKRSKDKRVLPSTFDSLSTSSDTETLVAESCFSGVTNNVRNPSTTSALGKKKDISLKGTMNNCAMFQFDSRRIKQTDSPSDNQSVPLTDSFGKHSLKDKDIQNSAIKLTDIVGEGNFSIVRRGYLNKRDVVAVKSLRPHTISPEQFLSEAQLLIGLDHPNIVKLLGMVTTEEPVIVLEYFPKGNLQTYLVKGGLQNGTIKDIVNIAVQIVEGMIYVHEQKIIHCDLRAVNILVGNDGNIKIADFGLARSLEDNNGKNMFKEYLDTFPVRWTAPEGLFDDQFSPKSDVWSFGIVMYELITFGQEPYSGYTNDEVKAWLKKKNTLRKPHKLQIQDVPESYFEIMNSCCSYSIQKRPNFCEVQIEFKRYFSLS